VKNMKFTIRRTSLRMRDSKAPPCEEAYRENDKWMVKIRSLKALIEFTDKYDSIILDGNVENATIEIYDTWRE